MKKVVLLLLVSLGLAALSACGEDESESEAVEDDGVEEEVDPADEGPTTDDEEMIEDAATDDPMELITGDYDIFENGLAEQEVIGKYVSDESDDDGMMELEKDGYKVKFAFVLVHDTDNDKDFMYAMGEHENTNDDGGLMGTLEAEIKTDQKEITEDGFETGFVEPGIKETFANSIYFDNGTPDSFGVTLKEPIDKDVWQDEMNMDEDELDDWKDLTFTKQ